MKIIVAVLNWGLGHATRSIPVIYALQNRGFQPVLASDGEALLLLKKEFPELHWFALPSYNISYPKRGKWMKLHFLLRSPGILRAILAEHRALNKMIENDDRILGIISDNRLGAYSIKVPSVYLTHQLQVFSGGSTRWSSKLHRYFINKYTECWIPDTKGHGNLSGEMTAANGIRIPLQYLGPLSRFTWREVPVKYDLLVLLSGPEPQRSMLEDRLLRELSDYQGSILFVRGKVQESPLPTAGPHLKIQNFLSGESLETALLSSNLVLARSGYSTIMDLAALNKKAYFIPTPGQWEQHYLAQRLQASNIAPYCSQESFSLKELEKITHFSGFVAPIAPASFSNGFVLFKGK